METMQPAYRSLSEVARVLEVDRKTVGEIVKLWDIPTTPHPVNASYKCVDYDAFRRIALLMNRGRYLTQSA